MSKVIAKISSSRGKEIECHGNLLQNSVRNPENMGGKGEGERESAYFQASQKKKAGAATGLNSSARIPPN